MIHFSCDARRSGNSSRQCELRKPSQRGAVCCGQCVRATHEVMSNRVVGAHRGQLRGWTVSEEASSRRDACFCFSGGCSTAFPHRGACSCFPGGCSRATPRRDACSCFSSGFSRASPLRDLRRSPSPPGLPWIGAAAPPQARLRAAAPQAKFKPAATPCRWYRWPTDPATRALALPSWLWPAKVFEPHCPR